MSFGLGAVSTHTKVFLCGLRRLCTAFRQVLEEVPLHITASTAGQIRSLARLSSWNISAVQLNLSADNLFDCIPYAVYKLPNSMKQNIVTVDMPGMILQFYFAWLKQRHPEGLCHLIIHTVASADLCYLEHLPHIQRLDLWDVSFPRPEVLVLPPLPMHATSVVVH